MRQMCFNFMILKDIILIHGMSERRQMRQSVWG